MALVGDARPGQTRNWDGQIGVDCTVAIGMTMTGRTSVSCVEGDPRVEDGVSLSDGAAGGFHPDALARLGLPELPVKTVVTGEIVVGPLLDDPSVVEYEDVVD